MDSLLTWIGLGGGALLVATGGLAWWEHRKRLLELKRDLALAENSRFLLEEHVRGVDVRLQSINATLQAHQQALTSQRSTAAQPLPTPAAPATGVASAAVVSGAALLPLAHPPPAALPVAATAGSVVPADSPAPELRIEWPATLPMELEDLGPGAPVHYAPTMPMDLTPH